ncbi:TetR family transcriptional regulator [Microbulbifer sp. TYP-18]|uniref:TetR family transcriptional regulator n=1 Tax=Microbulbifer sp. TYP-18 TaxID=3230024 RepID=UPI0034C6D0B7
MVKKILTREKILDAAEDVLRKFGPRKITVVDIARSLNVSHGAVYRHFDTKSALHEAITSRWLERAMVPLAEISNKTSSPKKRLHDWFKALMDIKREKATEDPEMFASYALLAQTIPKHIIFEHLELMIQQVEKILLDGVEDGSFEIKDCAITARCLFHATYRYHHPIHSDEWGNKNIKKDFEDLFFLLERAILKSN